MTKVLDIQNIVIHKILRPVLSRMRYIKDPGARFSKVPKRFGRISGDIILFLSSKRRCLEAQDCSYFNFYSFFDKHKILLPTDKRSDGQESCGKDDRAAESLGASPPNCIFVCESTRSDVPNSTSQSSIAVARKFTSTGTYATLSGVGNEETSLSPVCSEVNSASERRMTSEEFDSRLFGPWEEIMKCNKEGRESEEQGKEEESGKDDEMESQKACKHHNRRCEVWFPCCRQFYRCHRCHNSASNCENEEAKASHATHLKCSRCQFIQEVSFRLRWLRVHVTV